MKGVQAKLKVGEGLTKDILSQHHHFTNNYTITITYYQAFKCHHKPKAYTTTYTTVMPGIVGLHISSKYTGKLTT